MHNISQPGEADLTAKEEIFWDEPWYNPLHFKSRNWGKTIDLRND
jgi:hypothetical protein